MDAKVLTQDLFDSDDLLEKPIPKPPPIPMVTQPFG